MTIKKFRVIELFFFIVFSIISILPFFLVKYVPSLDGPQHLYNARLINELIKGNEIISQFFRFNPVIVGNSSSLFIMAFLMFVFPAWLAEKLFLSIYVIGLALSFRYFIKSMKSTDTLFYLLIFPFAFTSLFMMGYYNFSLAFIPFFLALGYLKRHEYGLGIRQSLWLMALGLILYLTHAIILVFLGLVVFLQLTFDLGYNIISKERGKRVWFSLIKYYSIVLLSMIPAAVLWILYYNSLKDLHQVETTVAFRPVTESLEEIYKLRLLIGFHHAREAGSNAIMFWSLLGLISLAFIPLHRYFPRLTAPEVKKRNNPDWWKWTFITVVLLILTLFLPDRMVTGSMTLRLSLLFFYGIIILISLHSFPKTIMVIGLIVTLTAFTWHRNIVYDYYERLNIEIADLEDAVEYIRPGTIVFPINCSDNWLQLHFHCYLGVEKAMVNIRNPQGVGQMPVNWNYSEMPNVLLGKWNQQQAGASWVSGNKNLNPVSADYIFIWRSQRIEAVEGVEAILDKTEPYYNQAFRSENGNALLLQLNN